MSQTRKNKARSQPELFPPRQQIEEETVHPTGTAPPLDTGNDQLDSALRTSADSYQMILANMEEGYYEADLAGNFTFFNRSFQEIMGYPHLELLGMNYRR